MAKNFDKAEDPCGAFTRTARRGGGQGGGVGRHCRARSPLLDQADRAVRKEAEAGATERPHGHRVREGRPRRFASCGRDTTVRIEGRRIGGSCSRDASAMTRRQVQGMEKTRSPIGRKAAGWAAADHGGRGAIYAMAGGVKGRGNSPSDRIRMSVCHGHGLAWPCVGT